MDRRGSQHRPACAGTTMLETTMVLGLCVTLAGLVLPGLRAGQDEARAVGAARHLAALLHGARAQAMKRGANVALRFVTDAQGIRYATFADGNRNGVRAADIARGLDPQVTPWERLSDGFAGAQFGINDGVLDADSNAPLSGNPLRLGGSDLLSFAPTGGSTSGTIYLCGPGARQYAVRVLGTTGRIRWLRYEPVRREWSGP
jgi:type II secretory pathway pseudopilin PulG